ncbi:MAG: hypothetical protein M0Z60_15185 [Nitrospiraceae bacterium]|nr:hypothetical protein [Nitrospiraceae bacterium]
MKSIITVYAVLAAAVLIFAAGCQSQDGGPSALLDRYFASAVRQDYATTYDCYYAPYMAKVSREDYVKHRKEASVLQSYQVLSLNKDGDNNARAEVRLTFAPSEKLHRSEPVSVKVSEDLVREKGGWKIKVW